MQVRAMCTLFAILVLTSPCLCYQQWRSIYQKITQEPEFSGFSAMIKNNREAKLDLNYMPLTVFVPENQAIDDYNGEFDDHLILYHLGIEMRTLKRLNWNYSLETSHQANPPLWISVTQQGYFINNAKILEEKSNYIARTKGDSSKSQVLHVIDRVLDPMVYGSFPNPTAYTFLLHHYRWRIGSRNVANFLHKIQNHNKEELFQRKGGHTFFLPIDQNVDDYKWESIDSFIIEGHVVPNIVLFTRPAERNFIYETAANGDYIYIVLSMVTIAGKDYVKSYTVLGNSDHKKGEVLSEIVKANIPVANGVVHLIKQPLAVFNRELKPFPYLSVYYKLSADPDLTRSFEIGRRSGLNKRLKNERVLFTFFIPRNRAWSDFTNYTYEELGEILNRHVVMTHDKPLSMAKLAMISKNSMGEARLDSFGGQLKVSVNKSKNGYALSWNGKNIILYRPDYECTDGIVHMVDDVFAEARVSSVSSSSSKATGFWGKLKNLVY